MNKLLRIYFSYNHAYRVFEIYYLFLGYVWPFSAIITIGGELIWGRGTCKQTEYFYPFSSFKW